MGLPVYGGRPELAQWCLTLAQRAGWGVSSLEPSACAGGEAPKAAEPFEVREWLIRSACATVEFWGIHFRDDTREEWGCTVSNPGRAGSPLTEAVERMVLASGGRSSMLWRQCKLWRLPAVRSARQLLSSLRAETAVEEEPVAALEPAPEIGAEDSAYSTKWVIRWRRATFEGFVGPAGSDLSRSTLWYFALYRPRRRIGAFQKVPHGAVLEELIELALRSVGAEAVDYRDRSH